MKVLFRISCVLILLGCACKEAVREVVSRKVIVVQPFEDVASGKAFLIYTAVKAVNPNTLLRKSLPLPAMAWYPARERYRADSLIRYLGRFGSADTILIGLTNKDISTTKGQIPDWGVMGLGYCPGTACVVSTYRLSPTDRDSQFYKVAIHELGHTQGLPHCKDPTCFMRDAEGGNTMNSEQGFCPACKRFLQNRGWKL